MCGNTDMRMQSAGTSTESSTAYAASPAGMSSLKLRRKSASSIRFVGSRMR
jgi:hypothetical protein